MDLNMEYYLYQAVTAEKYDVIARILSKGANPNKTVKKGRTCLGEAARRGNIDIIKMLLAGSYKSTQKVPLNNVSPRKRHKRKIKHHGQQEETIVKCKNFNERALKEHNDDETLHNNQKPKNLGYFVVIHNEGSSSDESKMSNLTSPLSPNSLTPSPQADLEWDEEIGNVAPSTSEDETYTSMYKWYAAILELTGAVIASASAVVNGINQQDAFMRTALHYASEQNHLNIVKILIEAGCKVDIPTGDGLTPLHLAVIKNHIEVVKVLIMAGSQVNYKTNEKMIPLHFAALKGYLCLVKLLVADGAHLDARDSNDRTALFRAVEKGHVDVVKYLISVGANINAQECHGYSSLSEAVWHGSTELTEILLEAGAHVNPSDRLLHYAIRQKKEKMVTLLAQFSVSLNVYNEFGDSPLLCATKMGQPRLVKLLLQKGANVNSRNSITHENALHIALEHVFNPKDFEKIIKILLDLRIDINASALLPGDTPLNRALLIHRDDAAALLIRYGVDVNNGFHTCCLDNLSVACRRESHRLVSLLLKAGHRGLFGSPCEREPSSGSPVAWLHAHFDLPLSLQDLCRITIRNGGRHTVLHRYVESLLLPISLKKFVMMENED